MTSVGQLINMNTFERRLALRPHTPESRRKLAYLASLGLKKRLTILDEVKELREIIELLTQEEES